MQRLKLDPIAYVLIVAVLGIQIYTTFLRARNVDDIIARSDETYKSEVYTARTTRA